MIHNSKSNISMVVFLFLFLLDAVFSATAAAAFYPRSCYDILMNNPASFDGSYSIYPDYPHSLTPLSAYCDMTTYGGGWTLVLMSNKNKLPPQPTMQQAVTSITYVGAGSDPGGRNVLVGLRYWNLLGTVMRVDMGNSSAHDRLHSAQYISYLDENDNYMLHMSSQQILAGGTAPGLYAYHNGKRFTTFDADHDDNSSGNCSADYGNAPWWYGDCWSGSFWGGGGNLSYQNGPYWSDNSSDYYTYGSIWLRDGTGPSVCASGTYSLSATSRACTLNGGSDNITLTTPNSTCPWTSASNASWIHITSGSSGTGNGVVYYTVDAHTCSGRVGTITIAGLTVTVTQDSGCAFTLSAENAPYAASGGDGNVGVIASCSDCQWNVASNATWITVTSGSSGTGNGTVEYSVAANTGYTRSGTITIGDQTFTINQASGCTFEISPGSASYNSLGGNGNINITASDSNCPWGAHSNDPWITITSDNGTGSGTLDYLVGANNGPLRTGSMTVAGSTFTVTQAARFADSGDGTVVDNATGLVWFKDANAGAAARSWEDALDAVDSLNSANVGEGIYGHNDWRLPALGEFATIIDTGYANPALLPGHPFINVQNDFYWTSSTWALNIDHAWSFDLGDGSSGFYSKASMFYVWPVRSGDNSTYKTMRVNKTGAGTGQVQSTAENEKLEVLCDPVCFTAFDNDTVMLTAIPDAGMLFGGWTGCDSFTSDNSCIVAMNGPREVTAEFDGPFVTSSTTSTTTPSSTTTTVDASTSSTTTTSEPVGGTTTTTTTIGGITTTTTTARALCPARQVLGDGSEAELEALRSFRDARLAKTADGARLVGLYYRHAAELTAMFERRPDIAAQVRELVLALLPQLRGQQKLLLSNDMKQQILGLIDELRTDASPGLKKSLRLVRKKIEKDDLELK